MILSAVLCIVLAVLAVVGSPLPSAVEVTGESTAVSTDLPTTPPAPVAEWLADASVGENLILGSSVYIIDNVVDLDSNSSLSKRETAQTYWTQVNVDETGPWWDCWATASRCAYGNNAPAGGSLTITTAYSRSFAISFGLTANLASNVQGVINGNGGLNMGFQWTRQWTWSTAFGCNVNNQVQVGQVFARPLMGWANTATRQCSSAGGQGTQCSGWTFGHINFPLYDHGQPALEGGCSQGYANVHCGDPIGTKFC